MEYAESALKIAPHYWDAQLLKIDILKSLNRFDDAYLYTKKVLSNDVVHLVVAANGLSGLYRTEAEKYVDVILQVYPDYIITIRQYHKALLRIGNVRRARGMLDIINNNSGLSDEYKYLSQLRQLCAEENHDDAAVVFGVIKEKYPNRVIVLWQAEAIFYGSDKAYERLNELSLDDSKITFSHLFHYPFFNPSLVLQIKNRLDLLGVIDKHSIKVPFSCSRKVNNTIP